MELNTGHHHQEDDDDERQAATYSIGLIRRSRSDIRDHDDGMWLLAAAGGGGGGGGDKRGESKTNISKKEKRRNERTNERTNERNKGSRHCHRRLLDSIVENQCEILQTKSDRRRQRVDWPSLVTQTTLFLFFIRSCRNRRWTRFCGGATFYKCSVAHHKAILFLFRACLRDEARRDTFKRKKLVVGVICSWRFFYLFPFLLFCFLFRRETENLRCDNLCVLHFFSLCPCLYTHKQTRELYTCVCVCRRRVATLRQQQQQEVEEEV